MRSLILNLFLMLSITSPAVAQETASKPLDISQFELTFAEDFNTLDVSAWGKDGSRWIAHTPWNGDFGDAHFTDPEPGFPFTVHDGILTIEAKKDKKGKWRSGLLASTNPQGKGFSQKFGYFEARMKLPPGKGVWPAFWLVGVDRSKFTAELDVMEYYGRAPDEFSSGYRIWTKSQTDKDPTGGYWTKVENGSLSRNFHTYGVDIEPKQTVIYFDRKPVWHFKTPHEFYMPFYPLVDLALGAGWPINETPNPSRLLVDYIHVYRRK